MVTLVHVHREQNLYPIGTHHLNHRHCLVPCHPCYLVCLDWCLTTSHWLIVGFRSPLGGEGIVPVVSHVANKHREQLKVSDDQQTRYCRTSLSTRISLSCPFSHLLFLVKAVIIMIWGMGWFARKLVKWNVKKDMSRQTLATRKGTNHTHDVPYKECLWTIKIFNCIYIFTHLQIFINVCMYGWFIWNHVHTCYFSCIHFLKQKITKHDKKGKLKWRYSTMIHLAAKKDWIWSKKWMEYSYIVHQGQMPGWSNVWMKNTEWFFPFQVIQ